MLYATSLHVTTHHAPAIEWVCEVAQPLLTCQKYCFSPAGERLLLLKRYAIVAAIPMSKSRLCCEEQKGFCELGNDEERGKNKIHRIYRQMQVSNGFWRWARCYWMRWYVWRW